ncbi:hypothetical protein, partial [Nodularia sp. UHCC 0506]|uniref:hypothetical protein n=1 Tax=Nodularia sp. UHCC 0506 TaxID=3110243 RepID=UPI002B216774
HFLEKVMRVVRVVRLRRLECSHSQGCSTRAFFEVVRVVVRGSTKLVRVRHKKYPTNDCGVSVWVAIR